MRMRGIGLLILVAVGASIPLAHAGTTDDEVSPQEAWDQVEQSSECKNPASDECEALKLQYVCKFRGSSQNAVMCAGGQRDKIERELNKTYQAVLREIRKEEASDTFIAGASAKLVEAEREWVKFREAECTFQAQSNGGGTLEPAVYEDCARQQALVRIESLKQDAKLYGVAK
jgi:uncharacterized protein YecT (DUF1311 family)